MKVKGLYQALGVAVYCAAVGTFMFNIEKIMGSGPDNFFAPVAFLLLFSTSALICGLLVFYQPYKLFFDNKKKAAADLVLYTTGWLFMFFVIFLISASVL